jgi:hypothetical protein
MTGENGEKIPMGTPGVTTVSLVAGVVTGF